MKTMIKRQVIRGAVFVAMMTMMVTSCGRDEAEEAERLCDSVEKAVVSGDTLTALSLVDTLNQKFPKQVAMRKRAKKIELGILIDQQRASKQEAETALDGLRNAFNESARRFYFEKNEKYQSEGRYLSVKQKTENVLNRNVLRPVVTEQGDLQIEGILRGSSLKAECFAISKRNGEAVSSDTVREGNAFNYVWSDGERGNRTILFRDTTRNEAIADFVALNEKEVISVTYRSTQNDGKLVYPLTETEKKAMREAVDLARKLQALRKAEQVIRVADKKIEVYQGSLMFLEANDEKEKEKL